MLEGLFTLLGSAGIVVGILYFISCMVQHISPLIGVFIFAGGVVITLLAWSLMSKQAQHGTAEH